MSPVYRPPSLTMRGAATGCAPSISPMGSTTSAPLLDTMTISRPARRCSSMRSAASAYTSGSTISCSVSPAMLGTPGAAPPPTSHRRQRRAQPVHLLVVGAGEGEDELGVRRFEHGAPVDQAAVEE